MFQAAGRASAKALRQGVLGVTEKLPRAGEARDKIGERQEASPVWWDLKTVAEEFAF